MTFQLKKKDTRSILSVNSTEGREIQPTRSQFSLVLHFSLCVYIILKVTPCDVTKSAQVPLTGLWIQPTERSLLHPVKHAFETYLRKVQ